MNFPDQELTQECLTALHAIRAFASYGIGANLKVDGIDNHHLNIAHIALTKAINILDDCKKLNPERNLNKFQSCGCVLCTCEDEIQCHGCGAKNCGTKDCVLKLNPESGLVSLNRSEMFHPLCDIVIKYYKASDFGDKAMDHNSIVYEIQDYLERFGTKRIPTVEEIEKQEYS